MKIRDDEKIIIHSLDLDDKIEFEKKSKDIIIKQQDTFWNLPKNFWEK